MCLPLNALDEYYEMKTNICYGLSNSYVITVVHDFTLNKLATSSKGLSINGFNIRILEADVWLSIP